MKNEWVAMQKLHSLKILSFSTFFKNKKAMGASLKY
jgi:hypothetical protein